jgi:hypothetical protein
MKKTGEERKFDHFVYSRVDVFWELRLRLIVYFAKRQHSFFPSNPKNTALHGSVCRYLADSFLFGCMPLYQPKWPKHNL